jgi:ligand-binding sensor domain-containing protein
MYCDTAGRVWILSLTEKSTYTYSENKFEKFLNINSIKNPIITTMNQDATGALWFGVAPHYAVRLLGDEETVFDLSAKNHNGSYVNCIFQDKEKNLWFGMDGGITIIHDGKLSYINKNSGLADDGITKIYQDSEKNIWIATDRGGLQKLSNGKFQTTKMSTAVNAIAQDLERNVTWIAGDNGLYCYKNNHFYENEITEYCKGVRIRHVSVTEDGALLVSAYEKLGK